jgi:tetratricopeptide (TPR) repeat protein
MVDVESSKVLYSGSLERTGSWESCADRADALPVLSKTWESFADSMAGEFVGKISPKYVYKKIQFLEDPDIPFSDSQKSSLKNGIEFVESGQLDKAEALFSQLVFDTGSQSYTASYNLGVVKEAQGEYLEAKRLYQLSGQLQKVPVEAISQALIRIDQVILKHQQAMKQIEQ